MLCLVCVRGCEARYQLACFELECVVLGNGFMLCAYMPQQFFIRGSVLSGRGESPGSHSRKFLPSCYVLDFATYVSVVVV